MCGLLGDYGLLFGSACLVVFSCLDGVVSVWFSSPVGSQFYRVRGAARWTRPEVV